MERVNPQDILKNEKKTFLKKIEFHKIMKNLIEVLMIYKKTQKKDAVMIDTALLEYTFLLLKLFKIMIDYYPHIAQHFQTEYKSYVSLIVTSLETAYLFSETSKQRNHSMGSHILDEKSDQYYYNIIYDSYIVFMFILENSKSHSFIEMKDYMSKILGGFERIYNNYLDVTKETEYHIFYLFMICQILKFLNKNKSYDVKYEDFYKKVFGLGEIKKRTNTCLKNLITNLDANENYTIINNIIIILIRLFIQYMRSHRVISLF